MERTIPDSKRMKAIASAFGERPEGKGLRFFSSPGRTELSGNHTDHNRGRVLAAAVDLDILAAVEERADGTVEVVSRNFGKTYRADLSSLEPRKEEIGTTEALIRGVAAGFANRGHRFGGFRAALDSRVLPGSGLSSSAAVEVLIGEILNSLYNDGTVPPVEIAFVGMEAENRFFGKPSGLMDQLACASGGVVAVDFADEERPSVRNLDFDFGRYGLALAVVDTGGSHADLTSDYASIPAEMKAVAAWFGGTALRDVDAEDFLAEAHEIRKRLGDRAVLRALHFFEENRRVVEQTEALCMGDLGRYLSLVRESGRSSWTLLQNCQSVERPNEQGLALALALTEKFLGGEGACRVHGGGFAGTIQVYLPEDSVEAYESYLAPFFGPACVTRLGIRKEGASELSLPA